MNVKLNIEFCWIQLWCSALGFGFGFGSGLWLWLNIELCYIDPALVFCSGLWLWQVGRSAVNLNNLMCPWLLEIHV